MSRFLLSLVIGLVLGGLLGLYLGWGPFAVVYVDSPASALSDRFKDDYTVMVAGGYLVDGDATAAHQRLRVLGEQNVPLYEQDTTERINTRSHDANDIYRLVALSEGLGRLTSIMEPYRNINIGASRRVP